MEEISIRVRGEAAKVLKREMKRDRRPTLTNTAETLIVEAGQQRQRERMKS